MLMSAPIPDSPLPAVSLKPGAHKRVRAGHPWVFSNEIHMTPEAKALPPGTIARLLTHEGSALGLVLFNPHPLISARLLTREPEAAIDSAFWHRRLRRALTLRAALFHEPFYRLLHAEADGFPGLIVDRFGEVLVVQQNTAGMERCWPDILTALDEELAPQRIILRNDTPARDMEGLTSAVSVLRGDSEAAVTVLENGALFSADPAGGQKTGWFYDQRGNRARVAALAAGRRVADFYCYSGGFSVQAALGGAREVVGVDRSADALDHARKAAEANKVGSLCRFEKGETFSLLQRFAEAGERFDLLVLDPPAFVKTKKDFFQGIKGYRKLARLAAGIAAPEALIFIASCSHHVGEADFATQISRGLFEAGREARILFKGGAGPDHPVHPFLPESAYLKGLLLALD